MGSGKLVFDGRPGAETIAHIRENGRVTVLFNAFDGPPRILRLYGKGQLSLPYAVGIIPTPLPSTGTIHEIGSQEYEFLLPSSIRQPGSRAVIIIDVFKVGTVRTSLPCLVFLLFIAGIRRADGQSPSTPSNLIAPSSSTGQPRKSARIASVVVVILVTRARRV